MQKYKSNIITTTGLAQRNISVRVLDDNGALAALYADRYGQTPIANPQVTAVDGTFAFYAANGRYSLQTTINGVTYTDQDVVLAADPEDMLVAGPIADAVNSATASVLAIATSAASAAQASQNAAAGSQGAAAASESNAAGSASAASASAATASGAADAASASETNAHASENAAATSAGNAATSESNALASRNAAATAAANAATYAQGYANGGAYAAGITLNDRFTFVAKDNELYRLADSVALPYTTTGNWAAESSKFVSIGDRNLREDLTSSAPAAGAALVAFKPTAAVARTVAARLRDSTSVMDFGAVGDGVTDDGPAIQAAISASYGRTLRFPLPSQFYFINTPLTIAGQARFLGEIGTFLKYGPGLSTSTDVISFYGAGTVEGLEIENLWIVEASGSPARSVLQISLDSASGLKKLRVSRCMFRAKNGKAINISNPSVGGNTNGLFTSVIEKSEFSGGIFAENLGDSVTIRDCTITGSGVGINIGMLPDSNPTGSSACLAIERNNITSQDGAITVNPARNLRIAGNNIEQTVAATSSNACVQLGNIDYGGTRGSSVVENNKIEAADGIAGIGGLSLFQCDGVSLKNNYIGASSKSSSFTYGVSLTNSNRVKIHDNTIYASTNGFCIGVTDAATKNTEVFGNKYILAGGAAPVNDAGTGTKGVWKYAVPAANWSNYSSSATQLSYFKDRNNFVHLRGQCKKSSAVTSGDLITTLASGFLPEDTGASGGNLKFSALVTTPGPTPGPALAGIRVLPQSTGQGGQVTVAEAIASIDYLSLDGLHFYSPDA